MKYRKKPVEVEAIQFTQNNFPQIEEFTNGLAHTFGIENSRVGIATCIIPTLEGDHIAAEGDYIIKGVKGEFYPCKPDIFEMTYETETTLKVKQKVRRFPNFVNTSDIESDMIWNIESGWRIHTCLERCAEVIVVYEKSEVDEAENALKEGALNE